MKSVHENGSMVHIPLQFVLLVGIPAAFCCIYTLLLVPAVRNWVPILFFLSTTTLHPHLRRRALAPSFPALAVRQSPAWPADHSNALP